MSSVLRKEYQSVKLFPGYIKDGGTRIVCSRIFEDFKRLCAEGSQPGTFKSYYESFGISKSQMRSYLNRHKLRVFGLPGYSGPSGVTHSRIQEIPFEDVIFEEAGFLPCNDENVITVRVDGHVAVSFPADTDVNVIAKFVNKTRKEAEHVGD